MTKRILNICWEKLFLPCTIFRLLFLGGYRLQKRGLDMGYSSQLVPIPNVKIENRVLLTSCLWNSSTVAVFFPQAVLFLCRSSEAFATRLAFSFPTLQRFFGLLPYQDESKLSHEPCKMHVLIQRFNSSVGISTKWNLSTIAKNNMPLAAY